MKCLCYFSFYRYLGAFVVVLLVTQVKADWSEEYVGELSQQVSLFESILPDSPLSPDKLLPLSTENRWYYSFDSWIDGDDQSNVEARLGELESLGDFCIRPLVFDNGRMELLLINHNDSIVLYGFRGDLNNKKVELLFQKGASATIGSGILLVAGSEELVQESQQGYFPAVLNGKEVQVEWFAINKQISSTSFSNANLQGSIADEAVSIDEGNKLLSSFRLNLGPCELEMGCFAAYFHFEFIPEAGLSRFRIVGDHPEIYIYQFQESPDNAFILKAERNHKSYFSCSAKASDDVSLSQGRMLIWFNISLVFVVLLRTLSLLRAFNKRILRVEQGYV